MADIKLTYFDFNGGRGEDSRLALHIAGVPFDDDRINPREQWPTLKPTTPYGGLPVLTIEGKGQLGESNAVLTYIGRTHGLHPVDPWEAARHEAVMNSVESLRHAIGATGSKDEDDKRRKREAFVAGDLQRWGANVEAQIQGPFLQGSTLNVADLKVFVILSFLGSGGLDHVPTDSLVGFSKLMGLHEAVGADPRVRAWYAAH